MKKFYLRNAVSYLTLAVLTGVILLGVNAAFGANPTLNPPADAVSPTFTGINFTANPVLKINGAVGTPGQVLGMVGGVLGWMNGGADNDWIINGNNMYSGVSGNVGIGTNNPTTKFQVTDGDALNFGRDLFGQTGMSVQSNDLNLNIGTKGADDLVFYTANQERMRLKGNGDLEMGGNLLNPSGLLGVVVDDTLRVLDEVGFGGSAITTVNLALHSASGASILFRTTTAGLNQKIKYVSTDNTGQITIGKMTDSYGSPTALLTIAQNGNTDISGGFTANSIGKYQVNTSARIVNAGAGWGTS
ncbi:MAG: hypothetical protein WC873_04275, partial [Candidatus Gracilibacteria bacterium]